MAGRLAGMGFIEGLLDTKSYPVNHFSIAVWNQ